MLNLCTCVAVAAQRKIGETSLNETSSRSHQILRLVISNNPSFFSFLRFLLSFVLDLYVKQQCISCRQLKARVETTLRKTPALLQHPWYDTIIIKTVL